MSNRRPSPAQRRGRWFDGPEPMDWLADRVRRYGSRGPEAWLVRATSYHVGPHLRERCPLPVPAHPPVLFLDVDGVCNHSGTYALCELRPGRTTPADWLDPACVARVQGVCDASGAVIVISSSWRTYLGGAAPVAAVLRTAGLTARVIDATPVGADDASGRSPRWREISEWLAAHPEVTRWAIVDDCDWEFPAERSVRTNIVVGITDADAAQLVAMLRDGGP